MGERYEGITKTHDGIQNLLNGDKATQYDDTSARHNDNITDGKATDNGAGTGKKAIDTGTGGKTTKISLMAKP